jgi:hypothetical protein
MTYLKAIRVLGNFTREDLGWAFGSTEPNIVSGVTTWFGQLLMVLRFAGSPDRASDAHHRVNKVTLIDFCTYSEITRTGEASGSIAGMPR